MSDSTFTAQPVLDSSSVTFIEPLLDDVVNRILASVKTLPSVGVSKRSRPGSGRSCKHSIEKMQALAVSRGGMCLSTKYLNVDSKILWKCAEGHTWEANSYNVMRGSWCPVCARTRLPQCKTTVTISDMQALAATKGGKCISNTYKNSLSKLLWECAEGHHWQATYGSISQGSWCPHCYAQNGRPERLKYSLADFQAVAQKRGGRCLATKTGSINQKVLWECADGHQWEIPFTNILHSDSWCPHCYNAKFRRFNMLKYTIESMQDLAAKRGGRCLSTEYQNTNSNLEWECFQGHTWKAVPGNVLGGTWCPQCNSLISEAMCRTVFEHIFGAEFKKYRPEWLRNSKGNRMELDGYCPELGIAFEYQGHYHYQPKSSNAADVKAFQRTLQNDQEKRVVIARINENGGLNGRQVQLVTVEKFKEGLKPEHMIAQIVADLTMCNIPVPTFDPAIDFSKVYQNDRTAEAQTIIEARGGKLISGGITSSVQKIHVQCEKGHTWWAVPYTLRIGAWCPRCAGNVTNTLEMLHECAAERGGKSLATTYVNRNALYPWECAKGHRWQASFNSVSQGSWCPHCNRNARLTIQVLQERAVAKGGKCLSTSYRNARESYLWECSAGHQWHASADSIQRGTWCPYCNKMTK